MKIYLVGFMGAGKTTVGRELAARLDVPFFDLDGLMQTRTPFGRAEGHRGPPALGGDSAAILREAGYSDGDIERLRAGGVTK